jgi:hypothetical protein
LRRRLERHLERVLELEPTNIDGRICETPSSSTRNKLL